MLPETLNLDSTSNTDVDGNPVDLAVYQGDDYGFGWRLRRKNSDGTRGAYIDLTGFTPKAQIRVVPGQPVQAEFAVVVGDQTATPGQVNFTLTGTQTGLVPAGTLTWDCQLTDLATKVRTYLRGSVECVAQVTT